MSSAKARSRVMGPWLKRSEQNSGAPNESLRGRLQKFIFGLFPQRLQAATAQPRRLTSRAKLTKVRLQFSLLPACAGGTRDHIATLRFWRVAQFATLRRH